MAEKRYHDDSTAVRTERINTKMQELLDHNYCKEITAWELLDHNYCGKQLAAQNPNLNHANTSTVNNQSADE